MDIESYEFREALEVIANIAWVAIKKYDEKTEKLIKNSYSIFKDSGNYYKKTLQSQEKILTYCYDRWITDEDIQTFSLWFSDSGIDHFEYLVSKWFEEKQIADSGIFLDLKQKKDKFLNRLIFPIQNLRGDIVAFAGRVLDKSLPKYLNSPASKIYDKSAILYWLFQARNEIIKKNFVIVTEWYMDVIALHRKGYKNTVCVSGTALTEKHITMLRRLTKKIYLCFDSDEAGKNATLSSIELLKNKGIELKIIHISSWKDPDEAVSGWENFQDYIDNAMSPIWFFISKIKKSYNLESLEEKKKFLTLLLDTLKSYSDNVERDFYLKEIARELDIDKGLVYLEFSKLRTKRWEVQAPLAKKEYSASEFAIGYILVNEHYRKALQEWLIFPDDLDGNFKKILEDSWYLEHLDLDVRDRYNAISLRIDDMSTEKTSEAIDIEIQKLIKKLNLDIYKSKRKELLESGKQEELVALLKVAREHWLK